MCEQIAKKEWLIQLYEFTEIRAILRNENLSDENDDDNDDDDGGGGGDESGKNRTHF